MHNPLLELRDLARQIEAWRLERAISKNTLTKRYGHLGSTKTYGRIIDPADPLSEGLDLPAQLDNYRAAWELIQSEISDPTETAIYADFQDIREGLQAVINATKESGNNRLVLVTGERGSGKTAFLSVLATDKRTANVTNLVEATEVWRDSTNELLGAMLMEVGVFERRPIDDTDEARSKDPVDRLPIGPGPRLRKLIERIDGRRLILAIDEGHHIGPAGFNLLKTIINQTRAVIVLTAIPVLLSRIMRANYAEAQQLFENRLYEVVKLRGPDKSGVIEFFKRRGVKFISPKAAEDCAAKTVDGAPAYALWNYVGRIAKEARDQARNPYSPATFAEVIVAVKKRVTMGN